MRTYLNHSLAFGNNLACHALGCNMLAIISSLFTSFDVALANGATAFHATDNTHSPIGAVAIAPHANCHTLDGIDSGLSQTFLCVTHSTPHAILSAIHFIEEPKSLLYFVPVR